MHETGPGRARGTAGAGAGARIRQWQGRRVGEGQGRAISRQGQDKGRGMAGRLRRPIIIIFLLSIASEKGTLGAHKKTVGHYLCNLHGGCAPGSAGT